MRKTGAHYIFIILGIIIVVAIVAVEGKNRNLAQKLKLKAKVEQFSKDIKYEEGRVAEATTDASLVSSKSIADIDTLKIAIDSAKKVYSNPNHTQEDITMSSNSLSTAGNVFDSSTSAYQPLEDTTSTDTTNTKTSGTDEQIWQYCMKRWADYDILAGKYSADKYDTEVFNDASVKFSITVSEAQATWYKVDKVKKGVTD